MRPGEIWRDDRDGEVLLIVERGDDSDHFLARVIVPGDGTLGETEIGEIVRRRAIHGYSRLHPNPVHRRVLVGASTRVLGLELRQAAVDLLNDTSSTGSIAIELRVVRVET